MSHISHKVNGVFFQLIFRTWFAIAIGKAFVKRYSDKKHVYVLL